METQVKVFGRRISTQAKLLRIFSFLLACDAMLLSTQNASADSYLQYFENESGSHPGFVLDPRLSLFSTSSNYDSGGTSTPLADGVSVARTYIDVHLNYGINQNVFLYGRVSALSSSLQNVPQATNTVFGFADQLLGLAVVVSGAESGTKVSLQAEASIPAYNNSNQIQDAKPYLGDQTFDFTTGAFVAIPTSAFSRTNLIELGAAYTFRSLGFSAAAPWSLFFKHSTASSNGITYAGGFRGQFSLNTDKTNISTNALDQNRGAAGSDLIYALNPAFIAAQGSIGYQWGSLHSYLTLADLISGKNSPTGVQISIGTAFDFGKPKEMPEDSGYRQADSAETTNNETKAEKNYDLDAKVDSVNDQLYLAKIDRGSDDGVFKGQTFDIFNSEGTMIARAKVNSVKNNEAALNVVEYYLEKWIEKGFVARRIWNENTHP